MAILSLTLHDGGRVWKGLDWDLMDLLYEKGWIVDPRSKAKSVVLTEDGERLAAEFLRKYLADILSIATRSCSAAPAACRITARGPSRSVAILPVIRSPAGVRDCHDVDVVFSYSISDHIREPRYSDSSMREATGPQRADFRVRLNQIDRPDDSVVELPA